MSEQYCEDCKFCEFRGVRLLMADRGIPHCTHPDIPSFIKGYVYRGTTTVNSKRCSSLRNGPTCEYYQEKENV